MDDHIDYKQAFLKLKIRYFHRLKNTVRIIDSILELESFKPLTKDDVVRARSLVHGLSGSGTTFGFPHVSEIGHKADQMMTAILRDYLIDESVSPQATVAFNDMMLEVRDICRESCREVAPEMQLASNVNIAKEEAEEVHVVLIIEDDAEVSAAIAGALEHKGVATQIAAAGEDALHYLSRTIPDLVILDVVLKGMDGLETLLQIKQNSEFLDVPVIVISARHDDAVEQNVLRAGAQAYMRKPLDLQILADMALAILEGKGRNARIVQ